jgi:hypothetical protein
MYFLGRDPDLYIQKLQCESFRWFFAFCGCSPRKGRSISNADRHTDHDERRGPGSETSGHYALQVIVTDKLAKEKYRVAALSIDFEMKQ